MKEKIFNGQRDDEEFLFMFRRHMIAMRKGFYLFLGVFFVSCLPTFIFLKMEMLYIAIGGFFLGLCLFLYHFTMWYFTIFIVSDQRIRQVIQRGLFGRKEMDLPLGSIQSINFEVHGFFGEIFHFGDINILTMVGDLNIKNVDKPSEVYNGLQDAIADFTKKGTLQ